MILTEFDPDDNLLETGPAKPLMKQMPSGMVATIILIVACAVSFALGMLAERGLSQGSGLTASSMPTTNNLTAPAAGTAIPQGGQVVGDLSSKSYYLPWCSAVPSIAPTNKVLFASAQAAQAQGYTPGAGCPGI